MGRFRVNDARNIIPNTFEVGSPVNSELLPFVFTVGREERRKYTESDIEMEIYIAFSPSQESKL